MDKKVNNVQKGISILLICVIVACFVYFKNLSIINYQNKYEAYKENLKLISKNSLEFLYNYDLSFIANSNYFDEKYIDNIKNSYIKTNDLMCNNKLKLNITNFRIISIYTKRISWKKYIYFECNLTLNFFDINNNKISSEDKHAVFILSDNNSEYRICSITLKD